MKTMSARQAKNEFGALVDAARHEPVIVTKHDRPVVAVVPYDDLRLIPKYAGDMPSAGPGPDITEYIGSAKGLFSSPEDVIAFMRRERDRWD